MACCVRLLADSTSLARTRAFARRREGVRRAGLSRAWSAAWFMMQIGMIIGFFTAWPVNAWLIRKGWKEKM
ncbi:MAG: DUF4396 domain-containing protein [Solirubrobacteraceae bacterium]